jgi:hypothetical protein
MPSILKVYSNMQTNTVLKAAIEFTCIQFYLMHRIPFILQVKFTIRILENSIMSFDFDLFNFKLFASITQILDVGEGSNLLLDDEKVSLIKLTSDRCIVRVI